MPRSNHTKTRRVGEVDSPSIRCIVVLQTLFSYFAQAHGRFEMTDAFNKGEIIRGAKRARGEAVHPIVYLEERDANFFLGAMITHSAKFGNIVLKAVHFDKKPVGNGKPSYLVKHCFLKKSEWGPFNSVGRLSAAGIRYVEESLKGTTPEIWEDYLSN